MPCCLFPSVSARVTVEEALHCQCWSRTWIESGEREKAKRRAKGFGKKWRRWKELQKEYLKLRKIFEIEKIVHLGKHRDKEAGKG